MENKVESKVEPDKTTPTEGDIEPHKPYQANLEIQKLIENTIPGSEEPVQSAPGENQLEFQVT